MKKVSLSVRFVLFVLVLALTACGGGGSGDGDDGGTYTAQGTYVFYPSTMTISYDITSSNFPADCGPQVEIENVSVDYLDETTMVVNEMNWTRDPGDPSSVIGTWTSHDDGTWTLILDDTGGVSIAATGFTCDGDNSKCITECYFEVYGAHAGDYTYTIEDLNHPLLGTSDDGNVFDVSGYERFIIHVPKTECAVLFDAFGLDAGWVYSYPGPEGCHYTSNMEASNGAADPADSTIEGPPDGETMENITCKHGFYNFTTSGASFLTVYYRFVTP